MATALSRTTSFFRKMIFFVIIGVIGLTILQYTTGILFEDDGTVEKPPTDGTTAKDNCPKPNLVFSKLPKIDINSKVLTDGTKAIFSSDKPEKSFKTFPSTVSVYKILQPVERLGDTNRAKQNAEIFGFNSSNMFTNGSTLRWEMNDGKKTFSYDKATKTWTLNTTVGYFEFKPIVENSPKYQQLENSLLSKLKLSNTLFSSNTDKIELISLGLDSTIKQVESAASANIVRYNFYKRVELITCDINSSNKKTYNTDIIPTDFLDPSFQVDITGEANDFKTDIINMQIRENEIDLEQIGVYETITMQEAFLKIKNNQSILYWINSEDSNKYDAYKKLSVREFVIQSESTEIIFLEPYKYIQDDSATHYLQPYYKFIGTAKLTDNKNADFIFLVPALKDNNYQQTT